MSLFNVGMRVYDPESLVIGLFFIGGWRNECVNGRICFQAWGGE